MPDLIPHSYADYLQSTEWRVRRADALEAAGFRCQRCGHMYGLDVHHVTYERLGNERPEDLVVLCRVCHAELHGMTAPYATF